MDAQLCHPNLSGKSGDFDAPAQSLPSAVKLSGQQFFAGGVLQFQVTRGQRSEVPYDRLANTESDKFRLDWWKHGIMAIGPSPFLQNMKLFGLALQILENSRQKNTHQVLKGYILLDVGWVSGLISRSNNGFVVNGLVNNSASFVPSEVIRDTSDYLLQMLQKIPVMRKVLATDCASSSGRLGTELNRSHGGIHEFLTAGTSQIPRQPWVASQVPQKALSQSGKLRPLRIGYRSQRVVHISITSISLLLAPGLRFFRFHSKTRVWRCFGLKGRKTAI